MRTSFHARPSDVWTDDGIDSDADTAGEWADDGGSELGTASKAGGTVAGLAAHPAASHAGKAAGARALSQPHALDAASPPPPPPPGGGASTDISEEDGAREAEALGFDAARAGKLRECVDQSRTLDVNEIECMVVELGHEADHSRARTLQEEFSDVSRGNSAAGRSVSFPASLPLVAKLEPNKDAEASPTTTALFRRMSLSSAEPTAGLTRDGSPDVDAGQE